MKEIARHRTWADDPCGTRCGAGSSIEATKPLASFLEGLCRSEVAASITDLGCGDLHWISNVDLFGVSYRPERPKSARKRAHPLAGVTRPPLRGRDPRTSAELSGTERTYIHPHQGHLGIYLRDSGGSIVNGPHNTNFTYRYGKERVYTVLESEYASMKHQHSIA